MKIISKLINIIKHKITSPFFDCDLEEIDFEI